MPEVSTCTLAKPNDSVPLASGKVYVLAAVKSAEVSVPVNEAVVVVDCGCIAILSEPLVEDAITALPVVPSVTVAGVAAPVTNTMPPVPELIVADAAPVVEPTVTTFATAPSAI